MIELRAQNAGYVRRIEELQNRNLILEDRLDGQRIAEERDEASRPASRRIGAPVREAERVAEEPPGEEDDGTGVEYAGEAALPSRHDKPRPMLRMAGNGAPRVTTVAARAARDPKDPVDPTSPPQDSAAPTEKISVRKSASSASASAAPTTSATAPATTATAAGNNEPLRLYRQALDALKAGHHAAALGGFRKFLARYPRHDYNDNAQYWIGECYYDLKQYRSAVREFRRVVDRYPRGNKVADAMLKMGFAHLAMGERRDGVQDLESLRRLYPKHTATRLATARLGQPDDSRPSAVTLELTGP